MSQGIIKMVMPQMQGGVHKSWENKFTGKLNFGFNIVFEDGTIGNCGSEKPVYPLSVGTVVTYDITKLANGTSHITKVKKSEVPENGNNSGNGNNGKTYNDPVVVKRIAFSMCQSIARLHFGNAGISPKSLEEVNTLAKIYHQWVTSNIKENDPHFRDVISRRYYALQLAVECIPFPGLGIVKREQVIESAETFLKPLKEIGYDNQTWSTSEKSL
jgi:hypothetical protein